MNAVNSLAHQHFVHGSNVFLTVRSIGGGKEDIQTKIFFMVKIIILIVLHNS